MLVCHPLPCDLKKSTTSGLSRMVVDILGLSAMGLPRLGKTATSSLGSTSAAGRICLKSSADNVLTSPSALVKGCLLIAFYLPLVGFSKTNHSDPTLNRGKAENTQSLVKQRRSNKARLWIILTNILNHKGSFPIKLCSQTKRKPSIFKVPAILVGVKFNLHINYCSNKK